MIFHTVFLCKLWTGAHFHNFNDSQTCLRFHQVIDSYPDDMICRGISLKFPTTTCRQTCSVSPTALHATLERACSQNRSGSYAFFMCVIPLCGGSPCSDLPWPQRALQSTTRPAPTLPHAIHQKLRCGASIKHGGQGQAEFSELFSMCCRWRDGSGGESLPWEVPMVQMLRSFLDLIFFPACANSLICAAYAESNDSTFAQMQEFIFLTTLTFPLCSGITARPPHVHLRSVRAVRCERR